MTNPTGPGQPRQNNDDEDDWGRKPGTVKPGEFPPTPPPRGPSIVTWMYILAAVLVIAQIVYFYAKH